MVRNRTVDQEGLAGGSELYKSLHGVRGSVQVPTSRDSLKEYGLHVRKEDGNKISTARQVLRRIMVTNGDTPSGR